MSDPWKTFFLSFAIFAIVMNLYLTVSAILNRLFP